MAAVCARQILRTVAGPWNRTIRVGSVRKDREENHRRNGDGGDECLGQSSPPFSLVMAGFFDEFA